MAEINLLNNDRSNSGINTDFIAVVFARILLLLVIVAAIVYGLLFFFNWRSNSKLETTNKEVQKLESEALSNKDRNELVTRQEQLTHLEKLVDDHVYWSYLLPELSRVTLKSAKYTRIEADKQGKLNLTVSLPSYSDMDKYLQIFDLPEYNQQFSNVRVVGIDTEQEESALLTSLQLQLTFNKAYLKTLK